MARLSFLLIYNFILCHFHVEFSVLSHQRPRAGYWSADVNTFSQNTVLRKTTFIFFSSLFLSRFCIFCERFFFLFFLSFFYPVFCIICECNLIYFLSIFYQCPFIACPGNHATTCELLRTSRERTQCHDEGICHINLVRDNTAAELFTGIYISESLPRQSLSHSS